MSRPQGVWKVVFVAIVVLAAAGGAQVGRGIGTKEGTSIGWDDGIREGCTRVCMGHEAEVLDSHTEIVWKPTTEVSEPDGAGFVTFRSSFKPRMVQVETRFHLESVDITPNGSCRCQGVQAAHQIDGWIYQPGMGRPTAPSKPEPPKPEPSDIFWLEGPQ